ncbi:branched-chain amino acid ABC transporter permease [Desulfallas thermosapovorans]|uniref:Branched-chain amino acid transport system permease protein n=1 Tax=Desulfallas thermosapovorans DSM 6562 TaxID=1121431 RepID=A0A5S4ZPE1_9FIRM|nr:branched-chain amino acid ABC transporter permease [Desulfallas thermosapovorans]TYO93944.1 branched-chain amino acid transport system permease protein [Desulfallas thermosapovorans DSM 6562]
MWGKNKKYFWLAAALGFLAIPLIVKSNYIISTLIVIGLYAILVQGLGILMGYAGQVSFGHAAFFGLGAYAVAILTTHYSWPTIPALGAAVLLPGMVAAVIGRPTLKLQELYLALATLGFGILVHIAFTEGGEMTGGPSGLSGIPYLSVGGLVFDSDVKFFYLVWILLFLLLAGMNNLVRSRVGRALRAISESEYAAENAGIDTVGLKLQSFVFSALLAGLAGGLYAFYITFISPSPFSFHASVQFVLMAVVGGLGTLTGPLLGAALVVALGEVLRWAVPLVIPGAGGEYQIIFFGLILVILMVLQPGGLGALGKLLGTPAKRLPGKGADTRLLESQGG